MILRFFLKVMSQTHFPHLKKQKLFTHRKKFKKTYQQCEQILVE